MRKRFLLIVLSLISFQSVLSQEIPDPEFSQKPFYFRDGKLLEFEKADATMEKKLKGMGYGGVEYFYSVDGSKSSVRFASPSNPIIIIKMEDNSDPVETFSLCVAEGKKSSRRFRAMKMGALGSVKSINDNKYKITSKKLRNQVFEITIEGTLSIGEFALIPYTSEATMKALSTATKIFCFGID